MKKNLKSFLYSLSFKLFKIDYQKKGENQTIPSTVSQTFSNSDHKDTHRFPIERLAGKLESRNIPRNQKIDNICWIQFANRDSEGEG